ncbi:MAG: hypothetical protein ACXWLM_04205 [Myxococcales bacterium]
MSACDELRPKAAGIASLPEGDPEREEFLRHARGCEGCMRALREGERLMRMLAEVPMPAPSPEALQRAREAVLAEMRPARPEWALKAAAAIAGFFVPLFVARHLDATGLAAALVTLLAATLLSATAGALRAGAIVVLAASAGFAFAAGGVPGMPAAKDLGIGEFICPTLELIAAALPLAAAAWLFRKNPRPGALAQAAAAGALSGQAALNLACPGAHDAIHLWTFHVAGIALAAAIGFLAEAQLSRARS